MRKGSGKIKNFDKSDGLPSDNIEDVAVFRERVWVATSDGVGKFEGRWKTVDAKDGLPVTKVGSIATQRDYIWFGTPSGVARYGPLGPGLSFGSPYFLLIILGVVGGALLIVLRPGAKKEEAEGPSRSRTRPEATTSKKPPYEICGGTPKRELCSLCKFYTLRSGAIRCGKYDIAIEFKDDGEGRLRQQSRPSAKQPTGEDEDKPS
jgi:hypothetical protein